jgi:hypothetical protein
MMMRGSVLGERGNKINLSGIRMEKVRGGQ